MLFSVNVCSFLFLLEKAMFGECHRCSYILYSMNVMVCSCYVPVLTNTAYYVNSHLINLMLQ